MAGMLDLGIVVVNYNVCELLRRCLASVFASQGAVTFRVCVVDNASADGSVAMLEAEFPQVELVANTANVGYPAANNQGLRHLGAAGRPRHYLLLNPDTEVPPAGLSRLVAYLDARPTIGVLGPRVALADGSLDLACRRGFPTPETSFYRMIGLSRLFPRSARFGRYNMTFLDEFETAEVDSVVGACMLVRGAAVDKVGLLDERFWMYGEDLDWAKRIKDAGWKVVYYPEVTVRHVKGASSRQNDRAQTEFHRAMLIFYYKHYRPATGWLLHLLVIAGIALKGGPAVYPFVKSGPRILCPRAGAG
ncbi:MAG: glycosyltransferase family 2 protein [Candidatus Promineifilaceae bacterium]